MPTQTALIVLGMHRSGTSAMAGVLKHLGVEFGSPLLLPREGVNDKGFWEHQHIVDLHQRILQSLDLNWYDIKDLPRKWTKRPGMRSFQDELKSILKKNFISSPIWAVKDPRLCRLLPLWFSVLQELQVEPKFILTFRSPFEVALSLSRRDNYDLLAGLVLWRKYFSEALAYTEKSPRIIVSYDELIHDWVPVANKIQETFSLEWPKSFSKASKDIKKFLKPSLKHWNAQDNLGSLFAGYFRKISSIDFGSKKATRNSILKLESSLGIENLVKARINEWHRFQMEHAHAPSVVEERDIQLAELNARLERLGEEHARAQSVVEDRDIQLAELNEQVKSLTASKFGRWLWKRTMRKA